MTNRLLDDTDALTLTLQQLLEENDFTRSLHRLRNFSAVNKYSRGYLNAHNAELARRLLGADMGMSPLDLATMILDMSISFRANLVHLAEQWNTPHAIEDEYFSGCAALALPRLSSELTAIGRSAFSTCTALNVVQWHAPLLTKVGGLAFEDCESLTLHTWQSPELIEISSFAFVGCIKLTLTNWHAPKLLFIRSLAFEGCSALVLPNGLPGDLKKIDIEHGAFRECTSLSATARCQINRINPDALLPEEEGDESQWETEEEEEEDEEEEAEERN